MSAADLVAAVRAGKTLQVGAREDRKCLVNGTRTRARLDGAPVCQGCWARAQSAAREVRS